MAKTIEQLKIEIAEQKQRISKETNLSEKISEKQRLSKELFILKNRKLIGAGAKAKRLSKRFGKSLLKVGKKVVPVVQKQARLIRDQQLRDDAITRARSKQKTKPIQKTQTTKLVPIKVKGGKVLFKRVQVKQTKKPKKSRKRKQKIQRDEGIFGNLDF